MNYHLKNTFFFIPNTQLLPNGPINIFSRVFFSNVVKKPNTYNKTMFFFSVQVVNENRKVY